MLGGPRSTILIESLAPGGCSRLPSLAVAVHGALSDIISLLKHIYDNPLASQHASNRLQQWPDERSTQLEASSRYDVLYIR